MMNNLYPLDHIRIVLSHTSHPGNIGASARAMKTMGLRALYLINPKFFPDAKAEALASHATDILQQAQVCAELHQALDQTALAAAVTARPRELSHKVFDARQGARELVRYAQLQPVALLFGRESSGLTSAEASKCQIVIHIPANPEYPSLNLASAVQVMSYELRMAVLEQMAPAPTATATATVYPPACFNELESLYAHLEELMITSGFLDPQQPKRLVPRLRRLFSRARLEKDEVQILRGILAALGKRW